MYYKDVVPTGFQPLDDVLGGGFHNGSLNIIAARPCTGKSTFALQCAYGMSKNSERKIYIQTLEHGSEFIKTKYPKISEENGFIIDDAASITPSQIYENLAQISNLGAIIIDYLQLMSYNSKSSYSRNDELSVIVCDMKKIAKQFNIPVILISQLPKFVDGGINPYRTLSDLKWYNTMLAQDPDVILFLYSDYSYRDTKSPVASDIIIAKNNFGDCRTFPLIWDQGFSISKTGE